MESNEGGRAKSECFPNYFLNIPIYHYAALPGMGMGAAVKS
jgi:hypothetical protein